MSKAKSGGIKQEVETKGEALTEGNTEVKMPSRKTRNPSSSSSTMGSSPPDGSCLSRQQRNLAEKQRRDKLNSYINELANLVPMVAESTKKLDKTSILRLSAAHLRLYHSCLNPKNCKKLISWCPNVFQPKHLNELLKAINGFLLVTTTTAKIVFTSKYVENYLGHQDIEMIGHSLYNFIHPDDHNYVQTELKKLAISFHQNKNSCPARSVFCARMRERSQPRSEITNYQLMRFSCTYSEESSTVQNHTKRSLTGRQAKEPVGDLMGGMIKYYIQTVNVNPFDELSIVEAFQEEYVTQHGLNGEILYADHRISTITGHLPHEVIGMLAYDYIFQEDVPVAQFAQKLMFSSSDGRGAIVYRLRSRDSTGIYLKTFGQLQYDKSSTKVSYFICINKLLSEEEGKEELKKFNDRYSPKINEFLAYSRNGPFPLNCEKTCQMIENGSLNSESTPLHSSDADSSFKVSQYYAKNILYSPSSSNSDKSTENSTHTACHRNEVKILSYISGNNADPGMIQWHNHSGIFHNNMLSETKVDSSRIIVNPLEINKHLENQIPASESRIQCGYNDLSVTVNRKRTADTVPSLKIASPGAVEGYTKHMKYSSVVLDNEVSHKKQARMSAIEIDPGVTSAAKFVDKQWLNCFSNVMLTSPTEQQNINDIDAPSAQHISCSNGKVTSWINHNGDSSSGDEQIQVFSPEEVGLSTSHSVKSWLEGTLQDLYPET